MILTADVERSIFAHLEAQLAGLRIDKPGEFFRSENIPQRWIEPRLTAFDRPGSSRIGQELEGIVLTIRCFVKAQPKGGRFLKLSELVDLVRPVIDGTAGAGPINIQDGVPQTVASVRFLGSQETREQSVTVIVGERSVPGVDVATLTLTGQLFGAGGC